MSNKRQVQVQRRFGGGEREGGRERGVKIGDIAPYRAHPTKAQTQSVHGGEGERIYCHHAEVLPRACRRVKDTSCQKPEENFGQKRKPYFQNLKDIYETGVVYGTTSRSLGK
jgi:hypothetical protein